MSTAAIAPTTTTGNVERALLVQGFLVALDSEGRSPATARLYQYGLQRLFGVLDRFGLGAVPLAQLTREHLEHALAELRREGLSPSTRQAVHRAMRAFWRWALEEGEIRENIAARVKAPVGEEKVVDVLTDEQRDALFRSLRRDGSLLGLRDLTAITILSDTGLRASELLSLTVEAIDVQQRRAIILGKGARERIIGLEPGTLRLLRRYWRRASIMQGAILRGRTGGPLTLSGLYLAIRRRGQQAGIPSLHPHVFRHGTATALLTAGVQEADVRLLLGWSRGSRMLERYTKSTAVERALKVRQAVRLVR